LENAFGALDEALLIRLQISQKYTNTSLLMSLLFWIASVLLTYFIYFRILNVRKELQLIIEHQKQAVLSAQKLATLGELSASIGHEIMNPISVIRSTASLMEKNAADTKNLAHAQRILKMTDRTQQIIKSLKTFAHHQEGAPGTPQNLHEGLAETLLLLNDKIRNQNISIQNELPEQLPKVLGTESELAQILMNIIGNAIDALKDSPNKEIQVFARPENEFVILSIKDNGPGIPAHIQMKIFDSLFTTKALGQGTGLGLAISKQIMERHGGFIKLNTGVENGAQFDLYFKTSS
jgi:two-component system C4-dicarboxylate transport sensor histidine kinase DctB